MIFPSGNLFDYVEAIADNHSDKNNPCDALEMAQTKGEGKHKGIEQAKENNDCSQIEEYIIELENISPEVNALVDQLQENLLSEDEPSQESQELLTLIEEETIQIPILIEELKSLGVTVEPVVVQGSLIPTLFVTPAGFETREIEIEDGVCGSLVTLNLAEFASDEISLDISQHIHFLLSNTAFCEDVGSFSPLETEPSLFLEGNLFMLGVATGAIDLFAGNNLIESSLNQITLREFWQQSAIDFDSIPGLDTDVTSIVQEYRPLLAGTIEGYVFNDSNENHVFDSNEFGQSGWSVDASFFKLDFSPVTFEQITQGVPNEGKYTIVDLPTGIYTVNETLMPGFTQTSPIENIYSLNVVAGSAFSGINFGNIQNAPNYETILFDDDFSTDLDGWVKYSIGNSPVAVPNPIDNYSLLRDLSDGQSAPSALISGDGYAINAGMKKQFTIPEGTTQVTLTFDGKAQGTLPSHEYIPNLLVSILDENNQNIYNQYVIGPGNPSSVSVTPWETFTLDITDQVIGHSQVSVVLGLADSWIVNYNQKAWFDNVSVKVSNSAIQPVLFFEDDYSSNTGWTQVGSQVTVDSPSFPGVVKFNNAVGGSTFGNNRVYKQLPDPLTTTEWMAEFDYLFTSSTVPGHSPFTLSPTSEISSFNFLDRIVVIHGTGVNELNVRGESVSDSIPILPNTQYFVKLERSSSQLILSVFSDSARTTHIPGSPVSIPVSLDAFTDLNFVQHTSATSGTGRVLTAEVDNTKIFTIGN